MFNILKNANKKNQNQNQNHVKINKKCLEEWGKSSLREILILKINFMKNLNIILIKIG
jgi:hypothetical protein